MTRDWYIRCLFKSAQTTRPDNLRLDGAEKMKLATKLLELANIPLQPFKKEFEDLDDHLLFRSYRILDAKEREIFMWLMEREPKGHRRYC